MLAKTSFEISFRSHLISQLCVCVCVFSENICAAGGDPFEVADFLEVTRKHRNAHIRYKIGLSSIAVGVYDSMSL